MRQLACRTLNGGELRAREKEHDGVVSVACFCERAFLSRWMGASDRAVTS